MLELFDIQTKKKAMKQSIIEYSKQYSIVTQFTSFVAIEERDEEEKKKLQYGPDSTGKLVKTMNTWSFILLWLAVCLYVVHQCVPITTDHIILLLTYIAVNNH